MNNIPNTAMIFAAGLGTRMLPLTENTPKPLVKVLGKPLIDYRLDKLVEVGVKKAVINTFHMAEMIEGYLSSRNDIEIVFSREEERLETGGGLVKALPHLGKEPFYIINSDVIWIDKGIPSLKSLADNWDEEKMDALLLLQGVDSAIGYSGNGDFSLKQGGVMEKLEKKNPYVFTGIQIFNPKIIENMEVSHFSLSKIYKEAVKHDHTLDRIFGIAHKGEWLHVDSIEGIKEAESFLNKI